MADLEGYCSFMRRHCDHTCTEYLTCTEAVKEGYTVDEYMRDCHAVYYRKDGWEQSMARMLQFTKDLDDACLDLLALIREEVEKREHDRED